MLRSIRLLCTLALVLTGFVACGGGGDDDANAAEASASVDAKADDGDDSTDGDATDGAASHLSKACLEGAKALAKATASASAAFTKGVDDVDSVIDELEDYVGSAPKDIRGDVKVVFGAYATFLRAYVKSGFDPSSGKPPTQEQMDTLQEAGDKMGDPEIKDASDRIEKWLKDSCDED
jgi:hypothetical protein